MRDDLLGDTERPFGSGLCAVPECPTRTVPNGFMCRYHWRLVPNPARRQVLVAWGNWNADDGTLGQLREAQFAAIDALSLPHPEVSPLSTERRK